MADNDNEIEQEEDDSPEYDSEIEQENGVFRWMSVVVVMLAIAGFLGLAWYAYKSGGEVVNEKDAELIQADNTPVKEAPANPGGMPIPNQDKTVYGLVGGKQDEGKVVEHIMAPPEAPVARNEDPETGTWMSDQVKEKLKTSGGESLPPAPPSPKDNTVAKAHEEAKPAPAAKEEPKPEPAKVEQFQPAKGREIKDSGEIKELKLSGTEEPSKPAPTEAKAPVKEAPKPEVKETPTPEVKPEVKAEPKSTPAPEKKTEEAKTPSAPPSGSRAQLGAFKSQAEADGQWKKIAKKFSGELEGKDHYIVRADLGEKGVYYRLQLAPFASSKEVDQFCLALVSEGQGCFPIKGK